ncbi:choline transporter of high affinity protein [Candidatus Photodesmus katoptron Akat1]|uniref:Choline transporter of high affinity protein n=1 Tax=Candidatus Photodesmus katoptron Akat1 TaxID=1236703 RepID=S3DKZ5_9GAMM|nr:choline transporter of high affinity protein [Candidatus Photodesmus katoptron Akat1]
MLFAAGTGVGLMFWGVAEPVAHFIGWYETPLNVTANSDEAAHLALGATMYHWGLHPWSIYAVVSLSLAFFTYNKGFPLAIRSVFYPLLGDKTWGWIGHLIDILATLATIFGLATSLGLAAQQTASGINHIFNLRINIELQAFSVIIMTFLAIISVVFGIKSGVRIISNINIIIAFILLVFVALMVYIVSLVSIPETLISYITNIIPLSKVYGRSDETWLQHWTIPYWAWWISWSPFVGTFIARISKGRTIRQLIISVLLIPSSVTLIWISVFGGIAINQLQSDIGILGKTVLSNASLAMFELLDSLPFGTVLSSMTIVLILVFFITSLDSSSLVIDSITSGGKVHVPIRQKVFWTFLEGTIAMILLWIGGNKAVHALQAGAISTALPFNCMLLIMCISLVMAIKTEQKNKKLYPKPTYIL